MLLGITGHMQNDGGYGICRHGFDDKHGFHHAVYNAKVKPHRANGDELFLGGMTDDLSGFAAVQQDADGSQILQTTA